MNRQQCEAAILEKMKEIVAIYHEYHPLGRYLSLTYLCEGDDWIQFNNRYWPSDDTEEAGEDANIPIDYHTSYSDQEVSKDDGVA